MKKRPAILMALLCLAPALIILFTFQIYPAIKIFFMSTYTEYNYMKHIVYKVGGDNFVTLFSDPKFLLALKNTIILALCVVPLSILLALFFSLLLAEKSPLKDFIRSIYFLPFVTSTIAISAVWRWIFHSKAGLLNYFLGFFGVQPIQWLTNPKWAMVSLIILSVWKSLGYNILIFVVGLRNIDERYYLAARLDGASRFQIIRRITLPLLSPSIFFVSITSLISSFKVFQEVYSLFAKSAGPLDSCLTVVYYIYDSLTNQYLYGLSAAASVVLFLIILLVTILQLRIGKKRVNY